MKGSSLQVNRNDTAATERNKGAGGFRKLQFQTLLFASKHECKTALTVQASTKECCSAIQLTECSLAQIPADVAD